MYRLLPKVIRIVNEAAEEPARLELCRFFCVARPCAYISTLSNSDANSVYRVEKTTFQIALSLHILNCARIFLCFILTQHARKCSFFLHLCN
jgi:hypothetical protein